MMAKQLENIERPMNAENTVSSGTVTAERIVANNIFNKTAVVILSGGMDSATVLAQAIKDTEGYQNVLALTFDYGQRHAKEMDAAKALTAHYGVDHKIFRIDLTQIGGSSLTDSNIEVPAFEKDEDVWKRTHVALTYVPMRNTIFIALAAAYAEVLGAKFIYTGFNWIDSGGYPDTTPEYVRKMNTVLQHTVSKPVVKTPLIDMTKKDIVILGQTLGVPWEKTWSCYQGQDKPCGVCNACVQRAKGFKEAGFYDPVVTANAKP